MSALYTEDEEDVSLERAVLGTEDIEEIALEEFEELEWGGYRVQTYGNDEDKPFDEEAYFDGDPLSE